jgi:hypothetical protein
MTYNKIIERSGGKKFGTWIVKKINGGLNNTVYLLNNQRRLQFSRTAGGLNQYKMAVVKTFSFPFYSLHFLIFSCIHQ